MSFLFYMWIQPRNLECGKKEKDLAEIQKMILDDDACIDRQSVRGYIYWWIARQKYG